MVQVVARSVSRQVKEWLGEGRSAGKVLAVHARACNLVTDQGAVIALVVPGIGDGPLNIVLGDWPGCMSGVQAGTRVTCGPDRLLLDGFKIALDAADTWEPCPNWDDLRAARGAIEASLERLVAIGLDHDSNNVLVPLLGEPSFAQGLASILVQRFREAALQLKAGWRGDEGALAEGGAALAGLGDGLTPAGDDFLMGVMLWAWLAHPTPRQFCETLSQAAVPRTTIFSAAFLEAAARGQCSIAWHRLLAALAEDRPKIAGAAQGVLARGASSGLDALIGFLYLSQDKEDACR